MIQNINRDDDDDDGDDWILLAHLKTPCVCCSCSWRGREVGFEACCQCENPTLLSRLLYRSTWLCFCNYMNENVESAGERTFHNVAFLLGRQIV